mgnify:CR=1 FL=1
MSSKRKDIRDAIAALLLAPAIPKVVGVFANRIELFDKSELPGVAIYSSDENAVPRDTSNSRYIRSMNLVVEVIAQANSGLDDDLDEISDAIEERILGNQELGGLAVGIAYLSTEIVLEGESVQAAVGAARINFEIKYIK